MIQIEEKENQFIVLLNGKEIGSFDTEEKAKEFGIAQIANPILKEQLM